MCLLSSVRRCCCRAPIGALAQAARVQGKATGQGCKHHPAFHVNEEQNSSTVAALPGRTLKRSLSTGHRQHCWHWRLSSELPRPLTMVCPVLQAAREVPHTGGQRCPAGCERGAAPTGSNAPQLKLEATVTRAGPVCQN